MLSFVKGFHIHNVVSNIKGKVLLPEIMEKLINEVTILKFSRVCLLIFDGGQFKVLGYPLYPPMAITDLRIRFVVTLITKYLFNIPLLFSIITQ